MAITNEMASSPIIRQPQPADLYGTHAARPLPGGVEDGTTYYETDTDTLWQAEGGVWQQQVLSSSNLTGVITPLSGTNASSWAIGTKYSITKEAPVNVTHPDFAGGAVGDNSTINDAAFSAAIAFAKTAARSGNQAEIFIPAGVYKTSQRIQLGTPVGGATYNSVGPRIYGEGPDYSRIIQTANSEPIMEVNVIGGGSWRGRIEKLGLEYSTQQTVASNATSACLRFLTDNVNGWWEYTIRDLQMYRGTYGIQYGPNSLSGGSYSGQCAFWNNTLDSITMANIDGALIKNSSGVAVGQPVNWVNRLTYTGVSGFTPAGGDAALALGSASDWQFSALDIEDWVDRILFSTGGGNIGIKGLHMERHHLVSTGTSLPVFTVSQCHFSLQDCDAEVIFPTTGSRWFVFPTQSWTDISNLQVIKNTTSAGTGTLYLVAGGLPSVTRLGPYDIDGTSTLPYQTAPPSGLVMQISANGTLPNYPSSTALPTASSSQRGQSYFVQGATTSVPDRVVTCLQDRAGNYRWKDQNPPVISVRDYLAVGDGTTDDTTAIQAAFTAAVAVGASTGIAPTVVFPAGNYKITSTITITPASGLSFVEMHVKGEGAQILWSGGSSTQVFKSSGWVSSNIEGLPIVVASGNNCTGVVFWDLDVNMSASPAQSSTGRLEFRNCPIGARNNANLGMTGWRICNTSVLSDGSESSFIKWVDCRMACNGLGGSTTPGTGNVVIQNTPGNQNSVAQFCDNLNFLNCDAALVTNCPDWHFTGGGGTWYTTFIDATGLTSQSYGAFSMEKVRLEGTARIIVSGNNGNRKNTFTMSNCLCGRQGSGTSGQPPPATGDMFTLAGPWDVVLKNTTFRDRDYTGTFTLSAAATAFPFTFTIRGGGIQLGSTTGTPFNVTGQPWLIKTEGTGVIVSGANTSNFLGGGTSAALPTIASAATLPIQPGVDLVQVTGTTGITAIGGTTTAAMAAAGGYAGRKIDLIFAGAVTLTNGTNLLLAGGTNFTTSANSVLSLVHLGGLVWREIGRVA